MTLPIDYAIQEVKGIKTSYDNAQKNKLDQYADNRIVSIYQTSEVSELFTSTEGMTGVKELGILETPPVLNLEDGYSVTLTEKRFGGAIMLPESVYRRDGKDVTTKVPKYLERQRNQLLLTNTHYFLTSIFAMINEAFDSSSDYLAPDGVEICGAHTWKSGGTFNNSDTQALDLSAIEDMEEYAGAFTDPAGKEMPLNFDTIIVKKGSAAARTARKLFAEGINPTAVGDINIYEGAYTIVETPFILAANKLNWFARCNGSLLNSMVVGVGEYPTMRTPITESNEAIRSNVTGFFKMGIANMPYDIYGSTGVS